MSKNFIEIKNDRLVFNFGELGADEQFEVVFNRTLRIPDDNKKYPLPPNLGKFPLEHVEDYANKLPENWAEHGGIFMPMYQSEAMWLGFSTRSGRPFAIKIASGKINAVSGEAWTNELQGSAGKKTNTDYEDGGHFPIKPQVYNPPSPAQVMRYDDDARSAKPDYMVAPKQPWLDGFNVGKGVIRQFVAVPLESGYTVEEQVTGKAEHGGLQIMVCPMKQELWEKIKARQSSRRMMAASCSLESFSMTSKSLTRGAAKPDMGLGAGGMMTQEIYEDTHGVDAWDQSQALRLFVHLANSQQYEAITGKKPPTEPFGPDDYRRRNYPWFEYYSDGPVLAGSSTLSKVQSIGTLQTLNDEKILPDDGHKPAAGQQPIQLGPKKAVRGGKW